MDEKFVLVDLVYRNECDIVKGNCIEELMFANLKMMEDWNGETEVTVKYPQKNGQKGGNFVGKVLQISDDRQLLMKTVKSLEMGTCDCNNLPIFPVQKNTGKRKCIPKYKNDSIWETGGLKLEDNEMDKLVKKCPRGKDLVFNAEKNKSRKILAELNKNQGTVNTKKKLNENHFDMEMALDEESLLEENYKNDNTCSMKNINYSRSQEIKKLRSELKDTSERVTQQLEIAHKIVQELTTLKEKENHKRSTENDSSLSDFEDCDERQKKGGGFVTIT